MEVAPRYKLLVHCVYIVYTVYTVYTIKTALHCINSGMYAYKHY